MATSVTAMDVTPQPDPAQDANPQPDPAQDANPQPNPAQDANPQPDPAQDANPQPDPAQDANPQPDPAKDANAQPDPAQDESGKSVLPSNTVDIKQKSCNCDKCSTLKSLKPSSEEGLYRYTMDVMEALKVKRIKVIGNGSFGQVELIENKIGNVKVLYAAKIISLENLTAEEYVRQSHNFFNECVINQMINHKHIVGFVMGGLGPSYGVVVMHYYPGGPLYLHLKTLSKQQVKKYAVNIMKAVKYLHSNRIIHRDLKTENVLVKNNDVFLSDFGMSSKLEPGNDLVSGYKGTQGYIAPEILASSDSSVLYDGFKADSYAFGVLLWCLLMKQQAKPGTEYWDVLFAEADARFYIYEFNLVFSAKYLLKDNPTDRLYISDVFDSLHQAGFCEAE